MRPYAEVDPGSGRRGAGVYLNCQQSTQDMSGSENFVPSTVLEARGSALTSK
jgi:hypothetical protein